MNYELVTLADKLVVGITNRTNNAAPDMGEKIGQLWQRFYSDGHVDKIAHRIDHVALGIYTDYASDEKGDYTVMVACQVTEPSSRYETRVIKGGKYAKFVVKASQNQLVSKVSDAWTAIWQLRLPRLFAADFEAYQVADGEQAEVHIYISLKE